MHASLFLAECFGLVHLTVVSVQVKEIGIARSLMYFRESSENILPSLVIGSSLWGGFFGRRVVCECHSAVVEKP